MTVRISRPTATQPSRYYSARGTVFALRVAIHGISGSYAANPLYWEARDRAGDAYQEALGAVNDQLDSTTVTAGQDLRGLVAFDLPGGHTIATVILTDPVGDQLAAWTV